MKKLIMGLLSFIFLFLGFQVNALDNGCLPGAIYSSTTGARCPSITRLDDSCTVGTIYSSITGKLCPIDSTRVRITRTLRWGTKGDDVKILQRYLGLYADGVYGRGTVAKVKEWQTQKGLNTDGTFGYYSRVTAGLE
ncbi:MAG: peptidoglycan-binding domain-containing protein [Candidatus Paceibacterota bacterium]